jgi:hypothetical protein
VTNYYLGLCQFCLEPMTLQEIAEGVLWEHTQKHWYGNIWWSEAEEENRVAHRRCWKGLKEWQRRSIRKDADAAPRSMGQRV